MKKYKIFVVAILIMIPLYSYSQSLKVKIIGVEDIQGDVVMALYNSYKTFMRIPYIVRKKKIETKEIILEVDTVIPHGVYAISVFQDKNRNNKLDTGLFGIPLEKYGFSNDAKGFAGAPSFRSSAFNVSGKTELIIKLE